MQMMSKFIEEISTRWQMTSLPLWICIFNDYFLYQRPCIKRVDNIRIYNGAYIETCKPLICPILTYCFLVIYFLSSANFHRISVAINSSVSHGNELRRIYHISENSALLFECSFFFINVRFNICLRSFLHSCG